MRNPNGYGTVYKLSGSRRNPYIARIPVSQKIVFNKKKQKDELRPVYQTLGYYKDRPSAMAALTDYYRGSIIPRDKITLEEVYKEWSEGKYTYLSKQTTDSYKAGWKHLSTYKNVKFTELRTSHFQSVIDKLHKDGMSRSTLEKVKIVSGMMYDYAMQNDIVNKNYAEFINLPKAEKIEKEIFSDLDIQKLEKVADDEWVMTILILIYTGLRINEFLSLTRFSINMADLTITGGLKTDAGKNRIIPINTKIIKYIQYWLNKNGDYLICGDKGRHVADKKYREDYYYPALESLSIKKLNPHCCRHTCASLLHRAGADPKYIQLIMGHSKYAFTADTYTHAKIEELKDAINKI